MWRRFERNDLAAFGDVSKEVSVAAMSKNKIVIIGGVAGDASCAARCRRLDESAKIVVIDRGPYVSFANCGLPY